MNSQPRPADSSSKRAPKASLWTILLHHSVTVIILVLFLAISIWAYLNVQGADFLGQVDHETMESELTPHLQAAQKLRVERALSIYERLENRYPRRLVELEQAGLLLTTDLTYPTDLETWDYSPSGSGYQLHMPDRDSNQEVPD